MPSVPKNNPPEATPERRTKKAPPSTSIMQGYEKMGRRGRRRIMWIGLAMIIAGGGVGLFGSVMSFYRFIIVLVFVVTGVGMVFPQYGIKLLEVVLGPALSKINPLGLFQRPDRRGD